MNIRVLKEVTCDFCLYRSNDSYRREGAFRNILANGNYD